MLACSIPPVPVHRGFNVTTPLKAWNEHRRTTPDHPCGTLQCDHAVEGVECQISDRIADDIDGLQCDHAVEGVECIEMDGETPPDAPLQCDHAVEGVECRTPAPGQSGATPLQCDHAVEGVECAVW